MPSLIMIPSGLSGTRGSGPAITTARHNPALGIYRPQQSLRRSPPGAHPAACPPARPPPERRFEARRASGNRYPGGQQGQDRAFGQGGGFGAGQYACAQIATKPHHLMVGWRRRGGFAAVRILNLGKKTLLLGRASVFLNCGLARLAFCPTADRVVHQPAHLAAVGLQACVGVDDQMPEVAGEAGDLRKGYDLKWQTAVRRPSANAAVRAMSTKMVGAFLTR